MQERGKDLSPGGDLGCSWLSAAPAVVVGLSWGVGVEDECS